MLVVPFHSPPLLIHPNQFVDQVLIVVVDKQRISLDGIREEGGAERHVKFNIDFDEWRR
jgi:hypothetical protein